MPEGAEKDRKDFLLHVYDQVWNNINRHILLLWESVGTIIAAFAVFSLVEKDLVPLNVAASLLLAVTAWVMAHTLDSANWFNRNLLIIMNIEKQFLFQEDAKDILFYFTRKHRDWNMIDFLRIQFALAAGVAIMVLIVHAFAELPSAIAAMRSPALTLTGYDRLFWLPYATAVAGAYAVSRLRQKVKKSYAELKEKSPGATVRPRPPAA